MFEMFRTRRLAVVLLAGCLSSLILAWPSRAATPVERGATLLREERYPEAERLLRRILIADASQPDALYYLGRVYLETERTAQAVRHFERAVARLPEISRLHQGLGEAYAVEALRASVLRQIGLGRESRQALERAVELDPDNVDARVSLFEFYRHAPGVVGGGSDRALRQVREIERREPSRGHELRANLLRDHGREQAAAAEYRRAIAADPSNSQARLSLALLHTEMREFDRAFQTIDSLLARDGDHMSALYQLGRNAALSGRRLDEGEVALRRYLDYRPRRNQPSHAWALYRLGMIQKRRGELATARYTLRKALRMDPELDGARQVLEEISS